MTKPSGRGRPAARVNTDQAPAGLIPARRSRRQVIGQWAAAVAVSVLIGAALTIMMATRQRVALVNFLALALISFCFAASYIGLYQLVVERMLTRAATWWGRGALHLLAVFAATLIGSEMAYRLLLLLGGDVTLDVRLRITAVGFAVLASIRLVNTGYERLRQRVREVELREERARRQALRAELAALQARTDPHFLFNALNTVAGLIEEDPGRAVQVVTRLGGFFRHSLQTSRSGEVALGEEIGAATTYLEIQSLRFRDRLTWKVDTEPGVRSARIPPLLLQPLLENAVVHGLSARGRQVHVVVDAARVGDRLRISVEDDGPGPGGSGHRGSRTSLADMAERLELLYPGEATLETGRSPSGGFRATLDLPLAIDRQEEDR